MKQVNPVWYVVIVALAVAPFGLRAVTWQSKKTPPADLSLAAASAFMLVYVLAFRRDRLRAGVARSLAAFAPAGVALAVAYDCLLEAFDRGRVSIVAPLNATQSLWAVVFSALLYGRQAELIGRRLVVSGTLVVAGAAVIGAVR